MGFSNSLKRSFLCLTAEPGSVCAGLPKKARPAASLPPHTIGQRQPPPAKSHFLSLPAELRNEIYSHALIQQSPIHLPYAYETRSATFKSHSPTNGQTSPSYYNGEPALLSASRTIRAEALPIFYGCNVFSAPSPAAAYKFLSPLPYAKIRALRMFRPIDLVLPESARRRWMESVKRCVNRLVKECGKGGLGAESIWVPIRSRGQDLCWVGLREAGFVVKDEGGGRWSLEDGGTGEGCADGMSVK